ncbi:hypothetical protein [Reinekea sp. G2M2-21]
MMVGFHCSDSFVDPGHQIKPSA